MHLQTAGRIDGLHARGVVRQRRHARLDEQRKDALLPGLPVERPQAEAKPLLNLHLDQQVERALPVASAESAVDGRRGEPDELLDRL